MTVFFPCLCIGALLSAAFAVLRTHAHQQQPSAHVDVGQRKGRECPGRVLVKSTVSHLAEAPQSLDDTSCEVMLSCIDQPTMRREYRSSTVAPDLNQLASATAGRFKYPRAPIYQSAWGVVSGF